MVLRPTPSALLRSLRTPPSQPVFSLRAHTSSPILRHLSTSRPTTSPRISFTRHPPPTPRSQLPPSFFSRHSSSASPSAPAADADLPPLTQPKVAKWLLGVAGLIFGVIVVGGVTRLTESGLSITEWKPVTGVRLPSGDAEWEEEFEKYRQTPEFKLLNHQIDLASFKRIYFMEWAHRVWGRAIGLAFVFPAGYFIARKQVSRGMKWGIAGLAFGIGFQGFLGWYMVKSGLSEELMAQPGAVPRVSQYRLAAHLGAALALYGAMLYGALGAMRDFKLGSHGLGVSGLSSAAETARVLDLREVRRYRNLVRGAVGLVFLTALSGAFVAGLDAGLLYNEFPLMGGRLVPGSEELFHPAYAKAADKSDLWWRSLLENPTTVQFDHRVLATTTLLSTLALTLLARRTPTLPPTTIRLANGITHAALLQVGLGISTLLYLVPTPLAAAHQAGSVVLLSAYVALLASLRKPGAAARAWVRAREAGRIGGAPKGSA